MKKFNLKKVLALLIIFAFAFSCTTSTTPVEKQGHISLLASHTIETGTEFDGFSIGGLSEIELQNDGNFIVLSDSRSTEKEGPSRFYSGHITLEKGLMTGVKMEKSISLTQADGNLFSSKERDPEAFVLQTDGSMFFASEGSHTFEIVDLNSGKVQQTLTQFLPEYYYGEEGLRSNQGIEGMSLSPDGTMLFVAAESALVADGEVAKPEQASRSRILKLQKISDGNYQPVAEYAYEVSAIPTISSYGIHDNGVSAILALDKNRLLVVERNGYAVKKGYANFDFNIRLYVVDLSQARNIIGKAKIPVDVAEAERHLLVNLSDLVETPDNVEGISWGPNYNGQKTVILVSDNNFAEHQANKFYQIAIPESFLTK